MAALLPVVARCKWGCRVALLLPPVVAVAYNDARAADPWAAPPLPPVPVQALDAVPALVWCVAHHVPMTGKLLRVLRSTHDCSDVCKRATSDTCRCRCGGVNHGVRA